MKILYLPTANGGCCANPWFSAHQIEDLSLFCGLESQGHEVTVAPYYTSKRGTLIWPRQLPKFFDPAVVKDFDMILLTPKFPGTISFLANPVMHSPEMLAYKHTELIIKTVLEFEGTVASYLMDGREIYKKDWTKDWRPYLEKQLTRESHALSKEVTLGFMDILQRIELRSYSPEFDPWGAKWCVENLVDSTEKSYDFVFDGYNPLKNYNKERREYVIKAAGLYPNSATLGRIKIDGLDQLNGGKMANGLTKVWPFITMAKYRPLGWEPFHIESNRLWTPRTMFAVASNSLAFTSSKETPFLYSELEDLEPPTKQQLDNQHELIRDFAAKDPWPLGMFAA